MSGEEHQVTNCCGVPNDKIPRIVNIEEAPAFLVDNRFLVRGYRKNFRRVADIIRSMILPHNETLNIWTHLLGTIFSILALALILVQTIQQDSIITHVKYLVSHPQRQVVSQLQALRDSHSFCPLTNTSNLGTVESNSTMAPFCAYLSVLEEGRLDDPLFLQHHEKVMGLVGLPNSASVFSLTSQIQSSNTQEEQTNPTLETIPAQKDNKALRKVFKQFKKTLFNIVVFTYFS
jgi:hypothetical protein